LYNPDKKFRSFWFGLVMGIFDTGSKSMILKGVATARLLALGLSAAIFLKSGGSEPQGLGIPKAAAAGMSRTTRASANPGAGRSVGGATPAAMLPARLLDCSLGRVTNFDPKRDQPMSEFKYDKFHPFKLFLPSIPARTTPPPDPTSPAEPVDASTRITADPDGISGDAAKRAFDRVVDMWPKRVELTTPTSNIAWNVIVIDQVNLDKSTATMFMSRANDAFTFDLKNMYYGICKIQAGKSVALVR
jgi:hypothetical protein